MSEDPIPLVESLSHVAVAIGWTSLSEEESLLGDDMVADWASSTRMGVSRSGQGLRRLLLYLRFEATSGRAWNRDGTSSAGTPHEVQIDSFCCDARPAIREREKATSGETVQKEKMCSRTGLQWRACVALPSETCIGLVCLALIWLRQDRALEPSHPHTGSAKHPQSRERCRSETLPRIPHGFSSYRHLDTGLTRPLQ